MRRDITRKERNKILSVVFLQLVFRKARWLFHGWIKDPYPVSKGNLHCSCQLGGSLVRYTRGWEDSEEASALSIPTHCQLRAKKGDNKA